MSYGLGEPIDGGDDVLWYLIEDFAEPTPVELVIKADSPIAKGAPVKVRAFEYDDAGRKSPAEGVSFKGISVTTDSMGLAEFPPRGVRTRLQGTREGAIPSNRLVVCEWIAQAACPPDHLIDVRGTDQRDRIKLSKRGMALVKAYGGRDKVDIRRVESEPVVNCGKGRDVVLARKGQPFTTPRSCEKVRRR